jgi:hypothetical protein
MGESKNKTALIRKLTATCRWIWNVQSPFSPAKGAHTTEMVSGWAPVLSKGYWEDKHNVLLLGTKQ